MGLRQIQVTIPKDKGAEILELLSIPLARTMWLSIQRRGNERIVRQVLTSHPELGEIRRVSVIAISGRPRFAVELYAQEPPSPEILRLVKDDLRQRLGEAPDLTLTVVSARVLGGDALRPLAMDRFAASSRTKQNLVTPAWGVTRVGGHT